MIYQSSIVGLFKTLMIIIGVFVLLRFLGQVMNAKRNMDEERVLNSQSRKVEKERAEKLQNFGKTRLKNDSNKGNNNIEDVEYEEVD